MLKKMFGKSQWRITLKNHGDYYVGFNVQVRSFNCNKRFLEMKVYIPDLEYLLKYNTAYASWQQLIEETDLPIGHFTSPLYLTCSIKPTVNLTDRSTSYVKPFSRHRLKALSNLGNRRSALQAFDFRCLWQI